MGEKMGVVPSPLHITKRRQVLGATLYLQDLFAPPPQLEGSDFLGLQGGWPPGSALCLHTDVTGAALPPPSHRPCQRDPAWPVCSAVPCLVHWTDLLTSPEGPGWGKAGRVLDVKKKNQKDLLGAYSLAEA